MLMRLIKSNVYMCFYPCLTSRAQRFVCNPNTSYSFAVPYASDICWGCINESFSR